MERGQELRIRSLAAGDLDAVVALDAALAGRTRRAYFERRLAAALRHPALHIQYAIESQGALAGFVLARMLEGEFGRASRAVRLETIGVAAAERNRGVGRALHAELEDEAARRGATEVRTGASWREHAMLAFLDAIGYRLAPAFVLECAVREARLGLNEVPVASPAREPRGDPNDWSAPRANDFEELARDAADVRQLTAADLEDLVRVDRHITGRERREFIAHALEEALAEVGVRVSLVAREGGIACGYIMARADYGDFGRPEPVAIVDAVGVAPEYARRGIGRAMLSQLLLNLAALGIERVETVVSPERADLLGFFGAAGFAPGERLAFVKPLAA
ncbi:MAG: GNAT family N-acetyltransferase [Burkholderiales bacterium]|nr:GNAT family N-acetyltransferase [Burkholderiales bacterium]